MNKLVKGYIIPDYRDREHVETAFAVTKEGDVYTTGLRAFSNHFNPEGQQWEKISALPEGAEFIGNYPQPNF